MHARQAQQWPRSRLRCPYEGRGQKDALLDFDVACEFVQHQHSVVGGSVAGLAHGGWALVRAEWTAAGPSEVHLCTIQCVVQLVRQQQDHSQSLAIILTDTRTSEAVLKVRVYEFCYQ
jgi:hypothetical protein